MRKISYALFLIAITSCQGAEFDSNSNVKEPSTKPPASDMTPEGPAPIEPIDPDKVFDNTPDDQAVRKCFKEWGTTPFDESSAKNYRVMEAHGTGFNSREISDRSTSKTNNLVLIKVGAVGFASTVLDLGNPHGWYCIASSATGFSSLKIRKHCKATIGGMQNTMTGFGGGNTTEYGDGC